MSLHTFRLEEKLGEVEKMIVEARQSRGKPGSAGYRRYMVLKAIAADLRARLDLPRSLSLGELERCVDRIKQSRTGIGYENGALVAAANTLINRWPFVRQALEHFGEETAE
jgi:hypothetical protein